jgi:hypothetical protein
MRVMSTLTPEDMYEKINHGDYKNKLRYGSSAEDELNLDAVREAYEAENLRLEDQFKQDCFSALGVSEHPKRDKLYSIAYDYGHSSGFSEIWGCMVEIGELIQ